MAARYDAYCGLYCGACPIRAATERGEVEEKAAEWGLPAEDIVCHGCKSKVKAKLSADCVMRLCAQDHGLESCAECDEYPCNTLQTFERDGYPHHSVIAANLEAIYSRGVDTWLAEQKERWSCKACGAPFTWYEDKCSGCGAELYDARAEERDIAGDKVDRGDEDSTYWKIRCDVTRFR